MIVRFWGVRGGIPTPEPSKIRYGGNTSCLSLELDDGTLIILDAGTGIRLLGNELEKTTRSGDLHAHVVFSHLHWDHIQGIPFFKPLFQPGNSLHFVGRADLQASLEGQQTFNYFPVDMACMSAAKTFSMVDQSEFAIGGAHVTSRRLNHPGGCLGYRFQVGDCSLVYATDTEHLSQDPDPAVLELAKDADILIYDSTYTPKEYEHRHGWGHSTWKQAIVNAVEARVKHLILFHHDHDRDDDQMDEVENNARKEFSHCTAAREGMLIDMDESREGDDWGVEISYPDGEDKVLLARPADRAESVLREVSARFPENRSFRLDATPLRDSGGEQLRRVLLQLDARLRMPLVLSNLLPEQLRSLSSLSLRRVRVPGLNC